MGQAVSSVLANVDLTEPLFLKSALVTALTPTLWNILARTEYNTRIITKLCCGSKYIGAYLMAAYIFSFSTYRDLVFQEAMAQQVSLVTPENEGLLTAAGYGLIGTGSVFVMSSFYRLGITGTFLGDYFGILMNERVTGFPFSVLSDPMYVGATMNFLGYAVLKGSPAGALLSAWVGLVYYISTRYYEGYAAHGCLLAPSVPSCPEQTHEEVKWAPHEHKGP